MGKVSPVQVETILTSVFSAAHQSWTRGVQGCLWAATSLPEANSRFDRRSHHHPATVYLLHNTFHDLCRTGRSAHRSCSRSKIKPSKLRVPSWAINIVGEPISAVARSPSTASTAFPASNCGAARMSPLTKHACQCIYQEKGAA